MNFEYGNTISKELQDIILKWTERSERNAIATDMELDPSTIQKLVKRDRNITENNEEAVIAVCRKAIMNRTLRMNIEAQKEYQHTLNQLEELTNQGEL